MPLAIDLLNPSAEAESKKHKLKRLVQSPNSYFMDVKCPGCFSISTVFSHAQTVVICSSCSSVLCQPTGGRARLTEGSSYRRKNWALLPCTNPTCCLYCSLRSGYFHSDRLVDGHGCKLGACNQFAFGHSPKKWGWDTHASTNQRRGI